MPEPHDEQNPLQAYFDWQVTTFMLARDLHDPVPHGDDEAAEQRRREMEHAVSEKTLAILPDEYRRNPHMSWPPEIMRDITRMTLLEAAHIVENAHQ